MHYPTGVPAPSAHEPGEVKVPLTSVKARRRGRFVPPMPLDWFQKACRLKGKAPIVAAALWYRSRLARSVSVALGQAALAGFGVSRQAKYRALGELERAGLVSVDRRSRKSPEVTVLFPTTEEAENHVRP